MVKKNFDPTSDEKKSLTFEEKITVAWAYHVRGVDQSILSGIYGVNVGRVNEACKAAELAFADEKKIKSKTKKKS